MSIDGLYPAVCVLVATVRALKMHGGVPKTDLNREDVSAVRRGLPNLMRHLENLQQVYGPDGRCDQPFSG